MRARRGAGVALLALTAALTAAFVARRPAPASLAAVQALRPQTAFACATLDAQDPYTVLVLGQSNAGNHGDAAAPAAPIVLVSGQRCYRDNDPLPGATGTGSSLWPRVAARMAERHGQRPLAFGLIALESSRIAEWTMDGPLHAYVDARLRQFGAGARPIALVLWQQGEADAKAGTSGADYARGLAALRRMLDAAGIDAPLVLAQSTWCPGSDGSAVRAAIAAYARNAPRAILGPDTDALQGPGLRHGCHFTARGLDAAAALWTDTLRAAP